MGYTTVLDGTCQGFAEDSERSSFGSQIRILGCKSTGSGVCTGSGSRGGKIPDPKTGKEKMSFFSAPPPPPV